MSGQQHPPRQGQQPQEPQSMRDILNQPLNQFQELTHTIFASMAPQGRPIPPPQIEALLECNEALAAAIQIGRVHQMKQRKIETLKAEVLALERQLREVCTVLLMEKYAFEEIIREGEERIKAIDTAEKAAVSYDTILAYAANLASMTSAPPTDSTPGPDQPAPVAFVPPFPDDSMLRRGILGKEAKMMPEPHGETREVGAPPVSPIGPPKAIAANKAQNANPYGPEAHYRPPPSAQDLWDLDLNPDF